MNNHKELPLVSVIITSFNRAELIKKSIDSVLDQNYTNLEIIIIDNCSTDDSHQIISSYAEKIKYIRYIKNENNIGFVQSLFKAINYSKGIYFTHVSSDDYLINPNFISDSINKSADVKNPVIICGNVSYLLGSNGNINPCNVRKIYKNKFFNKKFVDGKEVFLEYTNCFPITMGACIINKQSFINLNIDSVASIESDIEIILQLLLLGNVIFIDYEAYVVKLHNNNISNTTFSVSETISCLSFIEVPYSKAIKMGLFNNQVINSWKSKMLFNYSIKHLKKYYINNKQDYKNFRRYLITHYPNINDMIRLDFNWILYKNLFKFPMVGNYLKNILN